MFSKNDDYKLNCNKDADAGVVTDLSQEEIDWINNEYFFLITDLPVFRVFYIGNYTVNNKVNKSLYYNNYQVNIKESYDLKSLLAENIKTNFSKDKFISVVYSITKHSNYYRLRSINISIENIQLEINLNKFLRQEKIKLLLENDNNSKKKIFNDVMQSIDISSILTEEI